MEEINYKFYLKSYITERKYKYTKLDKHDKAIEELLLKNEELNKIIKKQNYEIDQLCNDFFFKEERIKHLEDAIKFWEEKLKNDKN